MSAAGDKRKAEDDVDNRPSKEFSISDMDEEEFTEAMRLLEDSASQKFGPADSPSAFEDTKEVANSQEEASGAESASGSLLKRPKTIKIRPIRDVLLQKNDSGVLFQNRSMLPKVYARYRETITGNTIKNSSTGMYNDIPADWFSQSVKAFNVGITLHSDSTQPDKPRYIAANNNNTEDFFLPKIPEEELDGYVEIRDNYFDPLKPTIFYTVLYNFDDSKGEYIDGHALLCVYFPNETTLDIVATYKLCPTPDIEVGEPKGDEASIEEFKKKLTLVNDEVDKCKITRAYKKIFKRVIERLYETDVSSTLKVRQPLVFMPKEINLQKNESEAIGHCAGWALILARRLTETGHLPITVEGFRTTKAKTDPTAIAANYWTSTFEERLFYYRSRLYNSMRSDFHEAWNVLNKLWKGGRRTRKLRRKGRRMTRRRKTSRAR